MVWLVSGAVMFGYVILDQPSNFVQGLYFTVQAGLGVGFGLLQMSNTPWRLFAIMYSMIGATFILATLTLWITSAERLARKRAETINELLEEAEAEDRRTGVVPSRMTRFIRWSKRHRDAEFAIIFYSVWLWVGVLFATLYWDMDIVTALTFAFFSMSTAGLQPPGDKQTVGLLFTTLYVAIGVPAFAVLCSYAIQLIKRIYISNELHVVQLTKTKAEFQERRDVFAASKCEDMNGRRLSAPVRECWEGDSDSDSDDDDDEEEEIVVKNVKDDKSEV